LRAKFSRNLPAIPDRLRTKRLALVNRRAEPPSAKKSRCLRQRRKRHAGPQVVNESFLHLRLANTLLHILAGAGIQANPKAFGWAVLDLHPDERVAGNKFPAGPT